MCVCVCGGGSVCVCVCVGGGSVVRTVNCTGESSKFWLKNFCELKNTPDNPNSSSGHSK